MKLNSITIDELIQALQIFQKHQPTGTALPGYGNVIYGDDGYLRIKGYKHSDIPDHDLNILKSLGFRWVEETKMFYASEYNPNR